MINVRNLNKNTLLVSLVIGLHFLWCGSAYLSWLYNVIEIVKINDINSNIDMISEVFGYIFQVIGIFLICIYIKKAKPEFKKGRIAFMAISIIHMLLIIPSILTRSYEIALITGFLTNIFNGLETGYYLIIITEMVPSNQRGLSLGLGYSIGSVGSWLLSLCNSGNFLKSTHIIIVYILLLFVTFSILMRINSERAPKIKATQSEAKPSLIITLGITIFLLCFLKGIGFYFPMADITTGEVSLELSRAFYAIGLLIAGLINDYKRQLGGITCLAALAFPFILLALRFSPKYSLYIWIMGYIFTGFYTVYRALVFSDIADRNVSSLHLAPLGLMLGRLGDSLGAAIGVLLNSRPNILVIIGSLIFAITVFIGYFAFYRLYFQTPDKPTDKNVNPMNHIVSFSISYNLSAREREVLPLILTTKSNNEISKELYVSESTIKYHIRNILKKTGCINRQELFKTYNEHLTHPQ